MRGATLQFCIRIIPSGIFALFLLILPTIAYAGPTLQIESANIAPDGRVLRVQFSTSPIPNQYSMPDWLPGAAKGANLRLSTGAKLEYIGGWASTADFPLPDIEIIGTNNPLPPGDYWVGYTIVDRQGNESQTSPPAKITLTSKTLAEIQDVGGFSLPKGLSANIYLSEVNGDQSSMRLYKSYATSSGEFSRATLDSTSWLDSSKPFPGGKKLTWTATYLITDPSSVVTIQQMDLTIKAQAGVLQDDSGITTEAFAAFPVSNLSLVDVDGFTSKSIKPTAGGVTLYVSSSKGSDNNTFTQAQNQNTPLATPSRAMALLIANRKFSMGSQILLRKGDTWYDQVIGLSAMGADQKHPMVVGSYWDGSEADRSKRPTLVATKEKSAVFLSGDRPESNVRWVEAQDILIRGLHLIQTYPNGTGAGISLSAGGSGLTIDDCIIQNFGANLLSQVHKSNHGYLSGLTVLRTALLDSHDGTGAHTQGAFIHLSKNALISQSIFDGNGKVSGARPLADRFLLPIHRQEADGGIF